MLANNKFVGEINSKRIEHFINNLDYNIQDTSDRIDKVKGIFYTQGLKKEYIDEYFEQYFNQERKPKPFFDVHLTQTKNSSQYNNVCLQIEKCINYILFCKQTLKENDISEYPYLTDGKSNTYRNKNVSFEEKFEKYGKDHNELKKDRTIKKYKKYEIRSDDLKEIDYLIELQKTINFLQEKINSQTLSKQDNAKYKRIIIDLKKEQIYVKYKIKKPIEFKGVLKDSTIINYESDTGYYTTKDDYVLLSENRLNLGDYEHIYALIEHYANLKESCYEDLNSDMRYILWSLEELIETTLLEPYEKQIVIWKIDKVVGKEIIQRLEDDFKLKITEKNLTREYKNICKKIARQYWINYEEWFYTYFKKGEYKKCSKCGHSMIASTKHFKKDKNGRMGLKSICRKCDC